MEMTNAKLHFRSPAVAEAVELILTRFRQSNAFLYPMRFGLAVGQRASYSGVAMTPPSLDIGVNDGSTAALLHAGKPPITWGGDMPEESTYESMGLFVSPEFNVYENLVGLDVSSTVPFPAESFNSISATEVFSYGIDRDRTLQELVRVLAPGGTLAFSDTAEDILQFPALRAGLEQFVPTLNVLEDSCGYYTHRLRELGLEDVRARLYFDRPLAALTHALMYAADPASDHDRYRRALVEDERLAWFYTDGLLAIASALDEEFARADGAEHGWHVFVSARKPGSLDPDLASPEPWCPGCSENALVRTLLSCRCANCGREYMMRFGIPYLLADTSATFSPKAVTPDHLERDVPLDVEIARTLDARYAVPVERRSVALFGVDPTTAFTIKYLRQKGLDVAAVGTTGARLVGRTIEQVPILTADDVAGLDLPIFITAYPGRAHEAIAALNDAGAVDVIELATAAAAERPTLPPPASPEGRRRRWRR